MLPHCHNLTVALEYDLGGCFSLSIVLCLGVTLVDITSICVTSVYDLGGHYLNLCYFSV